MKWSEYRYAALSETHCVTWGNKAPPYFAHKRGQRGTYGGSLGRHESKDAAKAACELNARSKQA